MDELTPDREAFVPMRLLDRADAIARDSPPPGPVARAAVPLVRYQDGLTGCEVRTPLDTLARNLGKSPRAITRYLRVLRDHGYLVQTAHPTAGRAAEFALYGPVSLDTVTPEAVQRLTGQQRAQTRPPIAGHSGAVLSLDTVERKRVSHNQGSNSTSSRGPGPIEHPRPGMMIRSANDEDLVPIVARVRQIRPTWGAPGVRAAIRKLPEDIATERTIEDLSRAVERWANNAAISKPIDLGNPQYWTPANGESVPLCGLCRLPESACRRLADSTGDPHPFQPEETA